MITPDFDAFETQEEAIYFLHHEHADCWCEVCQAVRKAYEVSALHDGTASEI